MRKRSECNCFCHTYPALHIVACCVPDKYFIAQEVKPEPKDKK